MRFYLISDNTDTLVGMRLAGIEGVVVHTADEVRAAVAQVLRDPGIGILLIAEKLAVMCTDYLTDIKKQYKLPLISEIPDRHGSENSTAALDQYIAESIGVRM